MLILHMWGPKCYFLKSSEVIVDITILGQCVITKSSEAKLQIAKFTHRHFRHFLIISIWQCYIFNGNVMLLYSSKCEDRHSIALPEKIQGFYYAILKKTGMLHFLIPNPKT